jgi:hypothetical protein
MDDDGMALDVKEPRRASSQGAVPGLSLKAKRQP